MDRSAIEALPMPFTYGRHLVRLFASDALFAGTGLTNEDLNDSERRITVGQALQYVRNALELATDPAWHLEWAGTLADHFHGITSIALVSAPTLGHGIDAFLRYFPSRIPYMHMQGRIEGEHFLAELCPLIDLGPAKPLLIETPMVLLQKHLNTVYGVDFSQAVLELDYPPTPSADRCREYFRCEVRYSATRNALVIPLAWRALPNLGHTESAWMHAVSQCEATLASSAERETLGDVRACLAREFQRQDRRRPLPTLNEVAEMLHLSKRTLIRRLSKLGTSYREATEDFLRARAQELLANNQIKIKQVSAMLGFDTPANFGKTFRRWYGVSPGKYRSERGARNAQDLQ